MDLKNKSILIVSPEPWGINHVSKHHFALELARYGAYVYFIDPPTKENQIHQVSKRLTVVKYKNRFRGLNRIPNSIRIHLLRWQINRLLKLVGKPIQIVWSFDPFRFQDLNLFKAAFTIFHSADYIDSKWDLYIAKRVELVLATSEKILERYQNINVPKYNIGHGLSNYFINPISKVPISFERNSNRIAVGYCGNMLMQYLDRPLLSKIIRENQHMDFYFIGPYTYNNLTTSISDEATSFVEFLKNQSNCFLLGPKPSSQLFWYLRQVDILLVCYQPDSIAYPHKILEYLSTGRVVVSNYLSEFDSYPGVVIMSTVTKDLSRVLYEVAMNLDNYNHEDAANNRIAFANDRSYKNKILEVENLLQKAELPG